MDLINGVLKHEKKALARAISKIENLDDGYEKILMKLFPATGNAYHIGITGPPGAGKSTIVDGLASRIAAQNKKIGIIAVDPTSPFSGGALLGDRIRMGSLSNIKNIFIRSMASRGSLGGLARATKEVALLMDAFGMDYILIETIGVGQVEIDVVDACDTTVLVLVPESGDGIQAMKAGLLEVADIIVVNKADREGAEKLVRELKVITELRDKRSLWDYPALTTEAIYEKGIDDLLKVIVRHEVFLKKSNDFEKNRRQQVKRHVQSLIELRLRKQLEENILKNVKFDILVDKILNKEISPFEAADYIMKSKKSAFKKERKRCKR